MSQNIKLRTHSSKSRVWVYFKKCDYDSNKARCNLCSLELCNNGTTTILWDHVKTKHSIQKNEEDQDSLNEFIMTPAKLKSKAKDLRQNSDFIDYNDLSLTSLKPLPSTSLSRNLISRLNQLSSPVTRKLKFWNKKSFQVNQYDPSFKVIYLGNLGMQLWSKDESCLDKPLSTLWNNYLVNMKTEIVMRLTICNSGLKAITRQHGLTQYWSNRLVYCCSHKNYPRIFSWVYRHEGKKMRQELRCHAVFCPSPEKAAKMVTMLNQRLACALQEFRREKKSRGINIVSGSNISSLQQKLQPRTIPLRRQILAKGSANFRPPLERSKSAPKLTSILEEDFYSDDDDDDQVSQDEYEFEESFGDRDDSDDSEEKSINQNDLQVIPQEIESNSPTSTVNEKTSNSGSTSATGDKNINNNNKQRSIDQLSNNEVPNGIPVEPMQDSNKSTNESVLVRSGIDSQSIRDHCSITKEASKSLSGDEVNNRSHKSQEIRRSSANIDDISRSLQKHVVANRDTKSQGSNSSLRSHGAKNNNTSNSRTPPSDQADDKATQEILLCWSNLVIK